MRFGPGIYTLVNRSPIGSDYKQYIKEYILDNVRYELGGESQITIKVNNNLIVNGINAQYYYVYKVATNESVIGNVSMQTA